MCAGIIATTTVTTTAAAGMNRTGLSLAHRLLTPRQRASPRQDLRRCCCGRTPQALQGGATQMSKAWEAASRHRCGPCCPTLIQGANPGSASPCLGCEADTYQMRCMLGFGFLEGRCIVQLGQGMQDGITGSAISRLLAAVYGFRQAYQENRPHRSYWPVLSLCSHKST